MIPKPPPPWRLIRADQIRAEIRMIEHDRRRVADDIRRGLMQHRNQVPDPETVVRHADAALQAIRGEHPADAVARLEVELEELKPDRPSVVEAPPNQTDSDWPRSVAIACVSFAAGAATCAAVFHLIN